MRQRRGFKRRIFGGVFSVVLVVPALLAVTAGTAFATFAPLSVCKSADNANGTVTGTFQFTVSAVRNGAPVTEQVSVAVGQCSAPVEYDPGTATVTESTAAGTELVGISANPVGNLVSSDLATRTATVTLQDFVAVSVTFNNRKTTTPPPPAGACHETINPAAKPAVGDNGFPDDPFGGDAVPGGTSTSPGVRGPGPINPDGFYLVSGNLFSDTTVIDFPGAGVAWPANTTVKYTEWGNPAIRITTNIGGPGSAIQYHIQAPGDLYAGAPKGSTGAVFCGVPPPPF